ncbi:MAG: histidinol-phosphate aminotransferase family protein [Peptococcaceae bacterium]|nr:histidinol-phosphate aminotransferase family protein [Peptococcaceae bacterium]
MTYQLPEKLKQLQGYQPGTICDTKLSANESFISIPDEIRRDIAKQIWELEYNRYPDPLAKKLCRKFAEFFSVPAELVTAANGSDELLFLLTTCFMNAGDKLMLVEPDFEMYRVYAEMAGVETVVYEKDAHLRISTETLVAQAREQQVQALVLSNPCNPSSLLESREDILRIVQELENVLIIVDEAYMDFADESVLQDVELYSNLIVLKTLSKAFGLAALRLGFAIANKTITNALRAVKSPYNVNTASQIIGTIVLDYPDFIHSCIRTIKSSRNDLYRRVRDLQKEIPDIQSVQNSSANFVYVQVINAADVHAFLQEKSVAVRLLGEYLRISAGTKAENDAVLRTLEEYWEEKVYSV